MALNVLTAPFQIMKHPPVDC